MAGQCNVVVVPFRASHIPAGSSFSTKERLPGLRLERLSEQQFPDAWQYLVSVAEKAWDFLRIKAS